MATSLDHAVLIVDDLDSAVDHYRRLLDTPFVELPAAAEEGCRAAVSRDGALELIQPIAGLPQPPYIQQWAAALPGSRRLVAALMFHTDDMTLRSAQLAERGVAVAADLRFSDPPPLPHRDVHEVLLAADPADGPTIGLVSYQPSTHHER